MWAWVLDAPDECWAMAPLQYRAAKSHLFIEAGVKPAGVVNEDDRAMQLRARNILRHSFASYHVALCRDAAETAILLQHRDQKMLWQHYRGRATEADARRYFAIFPT